jgi:hypothetical protein
MTGFFAVLQEWQAREEATATAQATQPNRGDDEDDDGAEQRR